MPGILPAVDRPSHTGIAAKQDDLDLAEEADVGREQEGSCSEEEEALEDGQEATDHAEHEKQDAQAEADQAGPAMNGRRISHRCIVRQSGLLHS